MAKDIEIGGRLHSTATGNTVAGANEVLDDTKNKKQNVINAEVDEAIGDDNTAGTIKGRIKAVENSVETLNGDTSTSGSVAKAIDDAKTELIDGATSDGNTLKKVEDRTATLETAVGSNGSVDQRIAAAKSEVIGDAASGYNTLGKVEDKIQEEVSNRQTAISEVVGDAASDYNTLGKLEDKIQAEASARQDAITAETNRATTRENQIYDLVHTPEQHYVTVATYAELTSIASPSDDTVYRVSSYNGKTSQVDNTVYSEYGYNGTNFVFLCVKSQIDEVYDISAHHSNNTYVDLAAALDGGNNIPQELRRGGMSVKFVQSSDNKYVRWNLLADEFTTDITQWAIADEGVYVENSEFVYVKTDAEDKILWAIKADGSIEWAIGIPTPVKEYIDNAIAEIKNGTEGTNLDGLNKIIAFLSELSTSDTLKDLLGTKVDKELGKGLIQDEVAENLSVVEEPEFIDVELDNSGKVLGGRKSNGNKFENMPIETPASITESVENPEYINLELDSNGRIIEGTKLDGTKVITKLEVKNIIFSENVKRIVEEIAEDVIEELDAFELPKYYFDDNYITNRIHKIQKILLQMGRGDVFGYLTDSHPQTDKNINAGMVLKYLMSKIPFNKVLFGGDVGPTNAEVYGQGTTALEALDNILTAQTERISAPIRDIGYLYPTRGNHDFTCAQYSWGTRQNPSPGMEISREATKQIMFAYCDRNTIVRNEEEGNDGLYYYFDNKVSKIRYIIIDTSDSTEGYYGTSNITMTITDVQAEWIIDQAILTTPSDYKIIIMGHVPIAKVCYDNSNDPIYDRPQIKRIKTIISAVNNKSVVSKSSIGLGSGDYDFSEFTPDVLMYITGHLHRDTQTIVDGCIYYCSSSDSWNTNYKASPVESKLIGLSLPSRVAKTSTEDVTNVVVVDIDNSKVNIIRIGVGLDRVFNIDSQNVSVGNTLQLSSSLSGSIKWYSYDADRFSEPDSQNPKGTFTHTVCSIDEDTGIVTGLSEGESVVVAYSESDNSLEFFEIKVNN